MTILEGRLWPCAAAAMFAMVLRWFIWLIAMVTEAGGRLTGIRGCGIIMKGSSRPETHEEVVGYSMMHIMSEISTGESSEAQKTQNLLLLIQQSVIPTTEIPFKIGVQ